MFEWQTAMYPTFDELVVVLHKTVILSINCQTESDIEIAHQL
ncbi:hypothetical protein Nizo1840_1893 [Lactiplantibacillus plantarum]|nr:hypothetical protein SF2A35B_1693 [Lactiplantibacillus plantarum]KZT77412.1 hypothetical protein Nizo1839_2858 [Lactiplantibacillus plantarum]KZT82452.1 hypothetical protein Nizo1840_1893 [Lactiplantibacillus plantarum]KZU10932.1 hypothetical protein Nizo2264_2689 [Lactiplantibacillus plantarum]